MSPIFWCRRGSTGIFVYCFEGSVVKGSKSQQLRGFIEALNQGGALSPKDLIKGASQSKDFEVLRRLSGLGAFKLAR
jgi:hypothetical protein